MSVRLWAIGPTVFRAPPSEPFASPLVHYLHDEPVLHHVYIEDIAGIGEPNAGEFLIETSCGFRGWVPRLNKNPDKRPTCEQCLNEKPSQWVRLPPLPKGAVAKQSEPEQCQEWPDE